MIRRRRVKFIWGASRVIRGQWYGGLFGFYERVPGDRWSGLAISARGVLAWGALLAALVYVAGATALFWVWRQNPYNQLTYADAVCYPFRRAEISQKKGRAFIAQGTELFRAGKYVDAANLLRLGLARVPESLEARRQLAQFYLLANQRPLANKVLQEGLGDKYPGRQYVEALCNLCEDAEDYDRIIATARRYLPHAGAPERRWLEGRLFVALLAAGKPDEALALAETMPPGDAAAEQRVMALLALKRNDDAVTWLERWRENPAGDRRVTVRLLVRAYREAGRLVDMQQALKELAELTPADPSVLAYAVVQQLLAGREDAAKAALRDYLFRFGGSPENLLLLAEPLAQARNLPLLQLCVDAAAERGYSMTRFHGLLAHTKLVHGQWAVARELLLRTASDPARDAPATRTWREWMERLLDAAESPMDSTQLALVEFLRVRPWPMRTYRSSIEALLQAGRYQTARDAIAAGQRAFPGNPWLERTAGEVKRQLEAAAPVAAADEAGKREPGEREFFDRLTGLVAEREWSQVEQAIRETRAARPPPAWLDRRDADLWLAQVQSGQARRDRTAMLTAARMFLGGQEQHAQRLLKLAREFHQAGDVAAAVDVTKEVLRRFPNYGPAKRQLAEFEPKPLTP